MILIKKKIEEKIIGYLKNNPRGSSMEIFKGVPHDLSYATIKRILQKNVENKFLEVFGKGKNTRYTISFQYQFLFPIDMTTYFNQEIDERKILESFTITICELLETVSLFSNVELEKLNELQNLFIQKTSKLSDYEYQKELERLAIDLSWKSSQIEGNTYSLLETERLLKEKIEATGKSKEEAIMLLNHKLTIDFIVGNPDYLSELSVSKLEIRHGLLIKDLAIENNIRRRNVGITGTNYRPLENEFQIRDALQSMCDLINMKVNVFKKRYFVCC